MSIGATLMASLLVVLDRPSTWPLALVTFLLRGGWLVVVAPIVVLPTAGGLANVVAPMVEDIAFGRRTEEVIGLVGVTVLVALVWLIGGGLIAAIAEVEAVRRIAGEPPRDGGTAADGGPGWPPGGSDPSIGDRGSVGPGWRVLVLRLIALVPLAIALAFGGYRLVTVAYRELTVPSDVALPVAWRIVSGAADGLALILVTWLFSEAVGALGARRVVQRGEGVRSALRGALRRIGIVPIRTTLLAIASTVVLIVIMAIGALASGAVWDALRSALGEGDITLGSVVLVVAFVAVFGGGLVLISLVAAWRVAIWTLEIDPRLAGTFGGGDGTRSGD
jgi:hypothetical protein